MPKAYVLLCNESGTDDSVLANLKQIPNIRSAYGTFGPYDILSVLEAGDEAAIREDVKKIRSVSQIRSTLTLPVDGVPMFSKTTKEEDDVLEKHMARAFVMIQCGKADEPAVAENLERIPEITGADCLVGSHDVICKIVAPTYNDISGIVGQKIRKLGMIKSTMTINVVGDQGFTR